MAITKIEYDGDYPNLCSGTLKVYTEDKSWVFPRYCLCSGGSVSFTEDWEEVITKDAWNITDYPNDFPEEFKEELLDLVNFEIPYGCCGGCV